eukprot:TRINITY_DN2899_c0_g2_i1.p1 TRINITY_DN2899_c0_g2~~TRINITY_DN2899_c0_g2_i1.p1  ORF type:complete len:735 (+),score=308.31 TRINITY_DN2899_c0_g2_i1:53-2206(+)
MGMKGKRRRLRQQLAKAEAERGPEFVETGDGGDEEELCDAPPFDPPPFDAPPFAAPPGMKPPGMKASEMRAAADEEAYQAAVEGKGPRKRKRPWWERRSWWQGRVPAAQQQQKSGAAGPGEQLQLRPWQPPGKLPQLFGGRELGLSGSLVKALSACRFVRMTEIQRRCIPLLLQRKDMLGQAKTGSGKTLAFVVPVLHDLLTLGEAGSCTRALIVGPTKELCHQILTVAQRLTRCTKATVPCALITGGTKVSQEQATLRAGVSVVVATPGRLLDHMRHTEGWQWKKMVRWLVIDEADRVLMEGFSKELDAILKLLGPAEGDGRVRRCTALFSATLARGFADLWRISFTEPPLHVTDVILPPAPGDAGGDGEEDEECEEGSEAEEEPEEEREAEGSEEADGGAGGALRASEDISHLNDAGETFRAPVPSQRLRQQAMIIPTADRLVHLYRLLRELHKAGARKYIVFFASCASAQYHCMLLNTVLSGSLQCLMLHGKMKHRQRVATFNHFCGAEDGVLFATDVAARGLDIPQVEWIVQYDPPTDPTEYLHRVGRTARGGGSGNALLFLSPQEGGFLDFLRANGVAVEKRQPPAANPERYHDKLHHLLLQDSILEKNARAAYKAFLMAYQQHHLKRYFDATRLVTEDVARSFCLSPTDVPNVPLARQTGGKAPYIAGVLRSMRQKHMKWKRLDKRSKAKRQWDDTGKYVGRAPLRKLAGH